MQIVPPQCQECPCNIGGVMQVVQNVMNLAIAFAVLIATFVIVWGGFLFLTSPAAPENRTKARGLILNAAIGLVIVLSSWLIIDAFMRLLYSGSNGNEGKWGPWNSIIKEGGEYCIQEDKKQGSLFGELGQVFSGEKPTTVPTEPTPNPNPPSPSPIVGNEAAVRKSLADAGIDVNKPPCPDGVRYQNVAGGCTTVGGLRENTVAQAIQLSKVCSPYVLTGGNELGHADGGMSHTTGYKIDTATTIDACIYNGKNGYFKRNGSRGSNARYLDKCSNEYVRESNHWDITVTKPCSQ